MTTPLWSAGAGAPLPRYRKLEGMKKDELIERVNRLEQVVANYYEDAVALKKLRRDSQCGDIGHS